MAQENTSDIIISKDTFRRLVKDVKELIVNPLVSHGIYYIHDEDDILEYTTDPELIHERYKDLVDAVIDGGYGALVPSTIIDCTGNVPELIRLGAGEVDFE